MTGDLEVESEALRALLAAAFPNANGPGESARQDGVAALLHPARSKLASVPLGDR